MRKSFFILMYLVLGSVFGASAAFAQDFSADVVTVSEAGNFTAKMYVSGEKSRMEMPEAVTISRADKKVAWILMPGEKMYMEQPINAAAAAGTQEKVDGEIERTVEGKENIGGVMTTKYRVTFETQGRRETVFQWIDETTRIPVKTAAIDGSWSTGFKNVRAGAQDQGLFEVPAGYQKMPMGMPQMESSTGGSMGDGE
jgi:hypothetical protein